MKNSALFLTACIILFTAWFAEAQDKVYARSMIDSLTADHMLGRAYFKKGDSIAADFIKRQFESMGLTPLKEDYLQHFYLSINIIEGLPALAINGKALEAGTDFLISSGSKTIKGSYTAVYFDVETLRDPKKKERFLNDDLDQKVIIADPAGAESDDEKKFFMSLNYVNPFGSVGIININDNNLIWSIQAGTDPQKGFIAQMKRSEIGKYKSVDIDLKTRFLYDYQTQNVVARIEGHVHPDSVIIIGGHYDHLGCMGDSVCFPGANDNASGVAMVLDLARHYSLPENKPAYTLVFIAFSGEEAGLLGSQYFTANPPFDLKNVRFMINLDLLGTGEEGLMAVNGAVFKEEFALLDSINTGKNYLPQIKKRGEAANSDHYPFYKNGVPSFFFYTMGGSTFYHHPGDVASTLSLSGYEGVFKLICDFISHLENTDKS